MSPAVRIPSPWGVLGGASDLAGTVAGRLPGRGGSAGEDGYFPPGNILREVMSERLVGLHYGQRALMVGALWPPPAVGTLESSAAGSGPFKRLSRTGKTFESIFFGSRAEADAELERVHKLHTQVKGEFPRAEGVYPAGTRYDAYDPEQMLWTMAVIADSSEYVHELLVRRLDADERERLWREWIRFAELFGMPRAAAPPTRAEFRAWYEGKLASDQMHLSDKARWTGYATGFMIPFPNWATINRPLHNALLLGMLPERARELYGLAYTPLDKIAFRSVVELLRASRRVAPPPLRRGRVSYLFDAIADTERGRLQRGDPTPRDLTSSRPRERVA